MRLSILRWKKATITKQESKLHLQNFFAFSILSLSHSLSLPLTAGNSRGHPTVFKGEKSSFYSTYSHQQFSRSTSATFTTSFSSLNQNIMATSSTISSSTALSNTASSSSAFSSTSSSPDIPPMKCDTSHPLRKFAENFDYSWINQLSPEDSDDKTKFEGDRNNRKRRVQNGHFVPVTPKPLQNPKLVLYSSDLAENILSLTKEEIQSPEFIKFFSGDVKGAFEDCSCGKDVQKKEEKFEFSQKQQSWATPYALSIMGTRYTSNCPFGTGEGYGDGRAISIAELAYPNKLEFQLKGGGPTPFCRGADGRAVLRSSIREFLASEAMHHLGVETTRALSLILSEGPNGDTSQRPWYREAVDDNAQVQLPDINDPRLAQFPIEKRKAIIAQLAEQKRDPDIMISEPNAITCRVAPSFTRIGHIDLYSRRVEKTLNKETKKYDIESREWKELEEIVWHAGYRELPSSVYQPLHDAKDISKVSQEILKLSIKGISKMVAGWVRVGFSQGNFNGDNCLVAGRTMDYGPFGFMDQYNPLFAKWTGSGEHFGFLNQPRAALANYVVLLESVMPLLMEDRGRDVDSDDGLDIKQKNIVEAQKLLQKELDDMWAIKLGFDPEIIEKQSIDPDELWAEMESLLRQSKADWTLIWRQLYHVVQKFPINDSSSASIDYEEMFEELNGNEMVDIGSSPFYKPLTPELRKEWIEWIQSWRKALVSSYTTTSSNPTMKPEERMRLSNPKYVLREWMLVDAYSKAAEGNYDEIKALLTLVESPYDEGTESEQAKYYRRAPDEALISGGTAFMS